MAENGSRGRIPAQQRGGSSPASGGGPERPERRPWRVEGHPDETKPEGPGQGRGGDHWSSGLRRMWWFLILL
ncbi:MAG TPA: hypothetical protein VLW53_20390, partial [Candidatus Eisenbacteria bacterium]|nr:hypothetical protein [Candidatus Eisenbacteria bacterium]